VKLSRIRFSIVGLGLLGAAALFSAGCANHESGGATPTPDTTSPEAVATRFFHWYVSERNLDRDPMVRASLEANADVTPEFINSMESVASSGRDPMLCRGQTPHAFTVGETRLAGDAARITVASNDSPAAWDVALKFENSAWRIAAITCAAGQ
jgi:hypothetical protein